MCFYIKQRYGPLVLYVSVDITLLISSAIKIKHPVSLFYRGFNLRVSDIISSDSLTKWFEPELLPLWCRENFRVCTRDPLDQASVPQIVIVSQ